MPLLFTVFLSLLQPDKSTLPAKQAILNCYGITGWGADGEDLPTSNLEADSRGAVVIEGPEGQYACKAQKDKYFWEGTFTVSKDKWRYDFVMTPR